MKKVLIIGAGFCCVIGALLFFAVLFDVIFLWRNVFQNQNMNYSYLDYGLIAGVGGFVIGYMYLAFTPLIMFIKARKIEMSRLRLVLIGVAEVVVIGLFLAKLFPKL